MRSISTDGAMGVWNDEPHQPVRGTEAKRDICDAKVPSERADRCLYVVRPSSRAAPPSRGLEPCFNVLPVSNKHHRRLNLNPDNYDLKRIPDTDTKKVEALKKGNF
jgi:hypothetical protein